MIFQREYIDLDGVIKVEQHLCVWGCEASLAECRCGFWMLVCRTCGNGPLCGDDEAAGICDEHVLVSQVVAEMVVSHQPKELPHE